MNGRRLAAIFVVHLLVSGCASPGFARSSQALTDRGGRITRGGFQVDALSESVLTVGMATVSMLLDREKYEWQGVSPCGEGRGPSDDARAAAAEPGLCSPEGLHAIDRWVTRQSSAAARTASDVGIFTMLAAPLVVSVIDTSLNENSGAQVAVDGLIIAEAYATSFLVVSLIKTAVQRPRPLTHNPDFPEEARFAGDARFSFPSGHSALAFTSASVLSVLLLERYGDAPGAWVGVVGAYLGAGAVASLRVAGGKHFVTDVFVGALIGTVVGLTVPRLHLVRSPEIDMIASGASSLARTDDRAFRPVLQLGGAF